LVYLYPRTQRQFAIRQVKKDSLKNKRLSAKSARIATPTRHANARPQRLQFGQARLQRLQFGQASHTGWQSVTGELRRAFLVFHFSI
jgi:hypothetical protein